MRVVTKRFLELITVNKHFVATFILMLTLMLLCSNCIKLSQTVTVSLNAVELTDGQFYIHGYTTGGEAEHEGNYSTVSDATEYELAGLPCRIGITEDNGKVHQVSFNIELDTLENNDGYAASVAEYVLSLKEQLVSKFGQPDGGDFKDIPTAAELVDLAQSRVDGGKSSQLRCYWLSDNGGYLQLTMRYRSSDNISVDLTVMGPEE